MSIVRASRSGSGGSGGVGTSVAFLSDGLYTSGSPIIPNVSQTIVIDVTSNLTTLAGKSYTSGSGITGLTVGSYCEIETAATIDNITGQTSMYLELINALDDTKRYLRRNMLTNKVDTSNSDVVTFGFVVTAEMATDGLRIALTGHRGSAGTKLFGFTHSIKEYS